MDCAFTAASNESPSLNFRSSATRSPVALHGADPAGFVGQHDRDRLFLHELFDGYDDGRGRFGQLGAALAERRVLTELRFAYP